MDVNPDRSNPEDPIRIELFFRFVPDHSESVGLFLSGPAMAEFTFSSGSLLSALLMLFGFAITTCDLFHHVADLRP